MQRKLIPDYLEKLQVYQAGKPIHEVAREKGLTHISKLASNENPLGPSPFAIREMTNALWDVHRYPDMHATDLKTALAELYKVKKENIILGNGSEGIMGYIARAFIQPGEEVLTAEKTFIGFHILATAAGAKVVTVPRTADMRYDVKELAKAVNENTKVLYIANPDNPTGTYITEHEFDYLMQFVPKHTIVILDEAYFEFAQSTWDYPDSMKYRYDNVITLRTFSKAYGLGGIRVGYGFANEEFIAALHKVKLPFEPSLIAQKGAVGALKDYPHLERTIRNNTKRYYETLKFLDQRNFRPIRSITNFISFRTGSEAASDHLFNELLNRGVIIRPLKANKLPDWVRVSIGLKEEMKHFFSAMDDILPNYDNQYGRPSQG
ncbi:MAG: histidinol-phosphate transaminase [Halobacteriovoraceae bacterium]|nr:histidinol-phosphate transaminase [Halobacteriovoraceae bacterium]|tara:strand:+ start:6100 stop:7233 length:1134 start_codon:yes stop_codon:yes gene_type:complete